MVGEYETWRSLVGLELGLSVELCIFLCRLKIPTRGLL